MADTKHPLYPSEKSRERTLSACEVPRRLEPEKHGDFELGPPASFAGRKLLPSLKLAIDYLTAHPEVLSPPDSAG